MSSVVRFDRGEYRKPVRMPNGWLRVDGTLTRTGVFTYRLADGSLRRELRLPEEVFHADALASFSLVPVTDGHPPKLLDATNTAAYARGAVGEQVRADGDLVQASLMVMDGELVAKVDGGQRELSCGYVCELEASPGEYKGERYDVIQRRIRGNHVAIVPAGRAGPLASVHMDAAEQVVLRDPHPEGAKRPDSQAPEATLAAVKIRLDEVEYEGTEQLQQAIARQTQKHTDALEAAKKDAAAKVTSLEQLQAKFDAQAAELEKVKAELKAAPEKLRADFAERARLDSIAKKHLGAEAKLDSMDAKAVKVAVLKQLAPELKLDGKSDAYIDARFDAEVERADADEEAGDQALAQARKTVAPRADAEERLDSDALRARMIQEQREAWKKPLGVLEK